MVDPDLSGRRVRPMSTPQDILPHHAIFMRMRVSMETSFFGGNVALVTENMKTRHYSIE